jgi:hypothetical protein
MNEIYRPTKTWALLAIAGLAFTTIFDAFTFLIGTAQVLSPDLAVPLDDGGEMSSWLMIQGILALLQLPVFLATSIVFLVWLNLSYKNLYVLRPSFLKFSSGWAVGYWFIPFLNLWKPFQVVREVWWESDPEIPQDQMFLTESLHSAPTYMGVWWAFWLGSNIANNIAGRMFDLEGTDNIAAAGVVFVVTSMLSITAAILAILVVRDITSRQAARYLAVQSLEERAAAVAYSHPQDVTVPNWN